MSKREKIILVVVFFAVMYGAYQIFLSSPIKTTSVDTEEETKLAKKLVKDLTGHLNKINTSGPENYIISKAEAKWVKDPFYKKKFPVIKKVKKEVPKDTLSTLQRSRFTYSGYIEMGEKRLAIINGMEYQTGEELKTGGWIVLSIYPTRVVIGIKGKQNKRIIHLVEELL